jgi:hypothetical protein
LRPLPVRRRVLALVLWIKHKRPDAFSAVPLVVGGNAETQWHQFVVCRWWSFVFFVVATAHVPSGTLIAEI